MELSRRQIEILSGLSAGLSTTIVTHPLDLIKTRLQLSDEPSKNVLNKIRIQSGGLNKYYWGLIPNLVGNISAWGAYFTLYSEFKLILPQNNLTLNYFSSSFVAGISTSLLTNPIWVLKTRIVGNSVNHQSMIKLAKKIVKIEGIRAFWKGCIPSLFLVFQASLQFTFYDHGKVWLGSDLSTFQYLYLSATSKILSMFIMYPTQVVKSRLQYAEDKKTLFNTIKQVWSQGALYNGLGASIIRVLPATCITFVVYELTKDLLTIGSV